ncbi:MAG TPA: DUF4382 domain-containing protein [Ramlibacter sp.]|nr:DUF4382 domain-containing protein [Ramlibacter sp.]
MRALQWIGAAGTAAVLAACGGGGGGGGSTDGMLRVALTDAPSCGYDHVFVTVEKVRVHQSSGAADADAGWSEVIVSPPKKIDLRTLENGVLEELGTTPLPQGQYSQIRLVLASNTATGTTSLANSVQPTGGTLTALSTPSAQQSGLKLQAHFDVAAGQTTDVLLDFDACKSVVKAGNSGQYILKPVVSVVPRAVSGIQGYVTTTLSLSSTTVAAQQNGVTIRSTVPDGAGKFSIPFLPAGTYTLVIASDGHATGVITGVPAGTATTVVSSTATAITTPASAMANVTGTVSVTSVSGTGTVSTALTDATVRALQTLTGGPTIELGNQAVDAMLGTYAFRLPVGAPVKAAFVSGGPVSFVADPAVAGKYTIQVQSPGRANLEKPADISSGSSVPVNFAYGP